MLVQPGKLSAYRFMVWPQEQINQADQKGCNYYLTNQKGES